MRMTIDYNKYVMHSCIGCGKVRKVRVNRGKVVHKRCKECYYKTMIGREKSLETRDKISRALVGLVKSEETRQKLHVSHLGKPSGNKGNHYSLESRSRISEARKRYFSNPNNRRLVSERMKEHHPTDEARKKQSETMKILRQLIPAKGACVKGSKRSEHFRNSTRLRLLGHTLSDVTKSKISKTKKALLTPEMLMKLRTQTIGMKHTEEWKMQNSIRVKQRWQDDNYRDRVVMATVKGNALKPNKKELKLSYILRNICPNEYRYNGDARKGVIFAGIIPDFINVNGQKKVIELFGDYWHGEKKRGRTKEQEEQRVISIYQRFGYSCLIIWESELKNSIELKQKIQEFVHK